MWFTAFRGYTGPGGTLWQLPSGRSLPSRGRALSVALTQPRTHLAAATWPCAVGVSYFEGFVDKLDRGFEGTLVLARIPDLLPSGVLARPPGRVNAVRCFPLGLI